jgi:DNA-binding MarR family transcriptional regulator
MQKQPGNTVQRFIETFDKLAKAERRRQPIVGLKYSEVRVLICIGFLSREQQQAVSISQISRKLSVTSPTVTELIKSLSETGHVERCSDAADKRVVDIKLTEKGERIFEKVNAYFDALFSGLIERLGEEQSENLIDLLEQVCLYLNETRIEIE